MNTLSQGLRRQRCRSAAILPERQRRQYSVRHHSRPSSVQPVFASHECGRRGKPIRVFSMASHNTGGSETRTNNNSGGGLFQLLNETERKLLLEQKDITAKSLEIAQKVGISTREFVHNSLLEDYSTFSVVIAGEYNAGKSTLINALVGSKLLESGSLPTTDCVTILSHAQPSAQYPGILHIQVDNLPLLQDLTLVDTPGTNAVLKDHTVRTLRLLPSADLILFVTSADRPFPESERLLLESIASYRKSIVIVINKMDILEQTGGDHGAREKQSVVDFVTQHASALLGGTRPYVLPVSARDALAAKLNHSHNNNHGGHNAMMMMMLAASALWKRSNFSALEMFLQESLTTETKLKSKLVTPLGIAEGILEQALQRLHDDKSALQADVATLKLLKSQFQAWRKELEGDMERVRKELSKRIELEGQRGAVLLRRCSLMEFYSACLVDKTKLRREWDKTLPADDTEGVQAQLLQVAKEAAESIATLGRAQGQAVIEFLGQRPSSRNQSLVGNVTAASRFEETRSSLFNNLTHVVEKHVASDQMEQENMLHSLERTMRLSASLNLSMLGSMLLMSVDFMDVLSGGLAFGLSLSSSAALVSFGRDRIVKNYALRWAARGRDLDEDLDIIFEKELDRVDRRVRDGVSPYTRFVEAEQERIEELTEQAEGIVAASHRLRHRINHPK